MYRLVALLLALLLPLQFTWGAAAAYCQHETSAPTARHIGHHAHEHKADDGTKKPASAKLTVDNDCTACHATCSAVACEPPVSIAALALTGRLAAPTVDAHASAPGRAPDRPQWRRLA
jgi:hypothetical protein